MTDTAKPAIAFIRRAVRISAALLLAMLVISLVAGSVRSTISIATGSVISMVSFILLALVVLRSIGGGKVAFVASIGILKMAAIGAALWYLVSRGLVEPLAFLAGFSTMVAALLFEGMRAKRSI